MSLKCAIESVDQGGSGHVLPRGFVPVAQTLGQLQDEIALVHPLENVEKVADSHRASVTELASLRAFSLFQKRSQPRNR